MLRVGERLQRLTRTLLDEFEQGAVDGHRIEGGENSDVVDQRLLGDPEAIILPS